MAKVPFDFVPLPREIWDAGLTLSTGEFRLLGYLLRHTEYGTEMRAFTDDELLRGRKRQDGSRVDSGCGIKGANNLKEARKRLQGRGWLALTEPLSGHSARLYNLSALFKKVSDLDTYTPSELSDLDTGTIRNGQLKVSETDTQSVRNGQGNYPNRTPKLSETDTLIRNRPFSDPSQTFSETEGESFCSTAPAAVPAEAARRPSQEDPIRSQTEAGNGRQASQQAEETSGVRLETAQPPPEIKADSPDPAQVLFCYYGGYPTRSDQDELGEALRLYAQNGQPCTPDELAQAVREAQAWWREHKGTMPKRLNALLIALRDLKAKAPGDAADPKAELARLEAEAMDRPRDRDLMARYACRRYEFNEREWERLSWDDQEKYCILAQNAIGNLLKEAGRWPIAHGGAH